MQKVFNGNDLDKNMAKGLLSDEEDGEEGEVQTKGLLSDEFDSDDEDLESDELDTEFSNDCILHNTRSNLCISTERGPSSATFRCNKNWLVFNV